MIEIFSEVPQSIRAMAELYFDTAIQMKNRVVAAKLFEKFKELCGEEYEDFADFYFNLRFTTFDPDKDL